MLIVYILGSHQNDLWVYNHTYFVWMAGNPLDQHVDEVRATGPNEFSYDNYPGTLRSGTSFIDNQGFIYLLAYQHTVGIPTKTSRKFEGELPSLKYSSFSNHNTCSMYLIC